jgi:hypothetical protein
MSNETPLSQSDRQISEWLFILTLIACAYFYAGGGWNQNSQFDLTRAIVEDHTFAIDRFAGNTGDLSRYNSHVYANKAPGLSLLAAIPYALILAFEHGRYEAGSAVLQSINGYACTVLTVGILAALVPAMLYREGRRRGMPPLWIAAVALTSVLATEMWPSSTMFVAQVPSAAFMFLAFVLARRDTGTAQITAGALAGLAGITNYLCIPAAAAITIYALIRSRHGVAAAARVMAGGAPFAVMLVVYQKISCGGFFTTPMSTMDERFVTKGAALGILQRPSMGALYEISIGPYRGLLFFAPVLVMVLAGIVLWFRGGRDRSELSALLAISAIFIAFNVSFNNWEGGFGIGARYLVPVIPLWGLAMLHCRGWQKPLLVVLALVSFGINFTATAVDPQPSGTIPRPLTQYLLPLLLDGRFSPDVPITPPWSAQTFTGHTSVNRFTHDEPVVFFRHAPGSVAAEWASFNLGEPFFGAGDARSLIPIAAILAIGVAAILGKARQVERQLQRDHN